MRTARVGVCVFTFLLFCAEAAFAFPALFGLSPDNSRNLLLSTIRAAQERLFINVYEFDDLKIADAVIAQIRAGVSVELLVEGEPLNQAISPNGQKVLTRIRKAMTSAKNKRNRLYIMISPQNEETKRRFKWNHAKYILVDKETVLISSENFKEHGHPDAGVIGNRGWEVVLQDPTLFKELKRVFEADTNRSPADIVEVGPHDSVSAIRPDGHFYDKRFKEAYGFRTVPSYPTELGDVQQATLITSPDSLDPLLKLLRSAKKRIEIETMSLPKEWKNTKTKEKIINPLVQELIRASKRGIEVRVLLNDPDTFRNEPGDELKSNDLTVHYLKTAAQCYGLPLTARIVDVNKVGITYIHNKGILVDGKRALVSSINGTQNSVMNNREVAVLLESPDAALYFGRAFDFDWKNSADQSVQPHSPIDCQTLRATALD